MGKVVSVINLKGGVGKTTLTVGLAEFLALEHDKKVLVIDTDPQTNASIALIGENQWRECNNQGHTLHQLFKDHLEDTCVFELSESIITRTSNLDGGLNNLHLLPSSLDFIQIQDLLINIGHISYIKPIDVLMDALDNRLNDYDVVLIDCPPNLGLVTQNALNISDYFLIPVIPDFMSTYGVPQIIDVVRNFSRKTGHMVLPLGIIISMYRANVTRHNDTIERLENIGKKDSNFPPLFATKIPLGSKISDVTDFEASQIKC
ncbi:MAG: AAA family ATPase [Syntrophomonadaceae bacterium]|nr:AAA family ATPase [Syntrophomonadaceae bacterium]